MEHSSIRVRFAPSPTGLMHIGNVRSALLNYLFARKYQGTFVLRIEDTDAERLFDADAQQIIADLNWLGLHYQEGPKVSGPNEPYFQSKRDHIYQAKLAKFIEKNLVYRCFCTMEELEKSRARQIALKQPSRYNRTCLKLSQQEIDALLERNIPFIWRFKLDHAQTVLIRDISHGDVKFELKNFSDFPLTRANGSFTFIFANFVDDVEMRISHVLRGDDHLTNTACQAAMYLAGGHTVPLFWHLPIICNTEGKKLSKRDFGFSLTDLRNAGFLPEAINNYLAIIGGSFEQEVMNFDELSHAMNFTNPHAASSIKYDVNKLRWVNHQWINKLSPEDLTERCLPFLRASFAQAEFIDRAQLTHMIQLIKSDLVTLAEISDRLSFYFARPTNIKEHCTTNAAESSVAAMKEILHLAAQQSHDVASCLTTLKQQIKDRGIPQKDAWTILRIVLTGLPTGPSVHDLMTILGIEESKQRFASL